MWHFDEYEKLREYDRPTGEQPPGGFRCHRSPDMYCAGWAFVHVKYNPPGYELLAFRISPPEGDLPALSHADVFMSGNSAADYGQADIERPSPAARRAIERLIEHNPALEPPPASFCHCHHRYEPVPEDVYRVCFECGHVYGTAADLVDAYNAAVGTTPPVGRVQMDEDDADKIFFCQHCVHDF